MDENNHLHDIESFADLICTKGDWEWVKEDIISGTHTDNGSFGISQIIPVEGTSIGGPLHATKEDGSRWERNQRKIYRFWAIFANEILLRWGYLIEKGLCSTSGSHLIELRNNIPFV
jgi:hypothetical protein